MSSTYIRWPIEGSGSGNGVTTYTNLAAFPVTGTAGQLGIALDTGILYEWFGSAWTAIATTSPGTVTSVGLSLPGIITVTNSPVTGSGTLTGTLAVQNANKVWAGPTTGTDASPTFRSLVALDIPALSYQSPLTFSDSLVNTGGTVTLVNDSTPPSASQYYGTDAGSVLGYHNFPTPGTLSVGGGGTGRTSLAQDSIVVGNSTSGIITITNPSFSGNQLAGYILSSNILGAPTFKANPSLGTEGLTTGQLLMANGNTSGASVTIQNASATTAYNFNLPATAGTSGYVLTSAGGGSSPMTWTSIGAMPEPLFTAWKIASNTIAGSGAGALLSGTDNIAIGTSALAATSSVNSTVAIGNQALTANTTGIWNVAIGASALITNTQGANNTAIGTSTLSNNLTGNYSTAVGYGALYNSTSSNNTAVGVYALAAATGTGNVALGYFAGRYETGANAFYVNNVNQGTLANDKAYSLLYGQFSGTAASLTGQQLTINGDTKHNGNVLWNTDGGGSIGSADSGTTMLRPDYAFIRTLLNIGGPAPMGYAQLCSTSDNSINPGAFLACYGNGSAPIVNVSMLSSRGTRAAPTATQSGDQLGAILFKGQRNTTVSSGATSSGIYAYATENFSTGPNRTQSKIVFTFTSDTLTSPTSCTPLTVNVTDLTIGDISHTTTPVNMLWANDSYGDIGSPDSGATLNRPGRIYFATSVTGPSYRVTGSSSGVISILAQAAAGTYNFNLPITAGSAGQVLTSQGGSTSAMTWTDPMILFFGSGSDGNVTISSGTTTLTRDMFYNNLTISGTATIHTAGYRIFVKGILDLTAAPALAINYVTNNGGNAASSTGGTSGGRTNSQTVGGAPVGAGGGNGQISSTGTQGTLGGNGTEMPSTGTTQGSTGAAGGAGGNGTTSSGGASTVGVLNYSAVQLLRYYVDLLYGSYTMHGGCGGSGGSGGGGDGANAGGGGGGAGAGGGVIYIAANQIKTSGATASAISALGGNGGNGFTTTTGTTGGGGGGAGGGGGQIYICYKNKVDAAATNILDVSGGSGGAGGNGTNAGGNGGYGGGGGRISLFCLADGSGSETFGNTPVTGNAASGTTGGASVAGQVTRVSF